MISHLTILLAQGGCLLMRVFGLEILLLSVLKS